MMDNLSERRYGGLVRKVSARLPAELWSEVRDYAQAAGLINRDGSIDISSVIRDLVRRGLVDDRGPEAGYSSGYSAGWTSAYAALMRSIAALSKTPPAR